MRFSDRLINLPNLYHVIDRSPLTISPDSYVVEAIVLMSQERSSNCDLANLNQSFDSSICSQEIASYILVVAGSQLLGILTQTDVVRLIASQIDLSKVTMAEVMIQPVITLRQSDSQDIFTALALLRQHQIRHLPILDDEGQLLGIITENSLLQSFDLEVLEQLLKQSTDEFTLSNQQIEIEKACCQTHNHIKPVIEAQSTPTLQTNQELQDTLEELRVAEEELRQQNEELVAAREATELQRQRYQDLFEFAPDAYLVTDAAGVIQEANNAAARLLAVRQNFLVGKPLIDFVAEQDRKTFFLQLQDLEQVREWEIYIQLRRGTNFPARIRVAAMHNAQGTLVGCRWLLCDISERKQVQEALRQSHNELERRVTERTAELVVSNTLLQQEITERQYAEVALRQSEKLYRHLVENQTDLIIRVDLQGRITFANTAACQTFDWKLDDYHGQSLLQVTYPDDLPGVMEKLQALALLPDYSLTGERRALTVNGIRWFQWNITTIPNETGEVFEIQGVARDITERKQMQDALLKSEEKFRLFANNINAVIWIASTDSFQTLYVSPAYEKVWGRSCQSLCDAPESWINTVHPDDRDRIRATVARQNINESISVEYRIVRPDGSVRWIWDQGFAIHNEQGEVNSYGGIAEDITERKLSEDLLRESEEKFRHFADNTHAILWIATVGSGENLYVNPAFEKIWGRSCQSLRNQPYSWLDEIHPDDRDCVMAKLERQKRGEPVDTEYRIVRADGSIRWLWDRGFAIQDEQGKVYSYGGIIEDISDRKLSEESLQKSETRLNLALEAARMGTWDWNFLTNEAVWSENMGPIYGLPSGALCPSFEDTLNLIHPEDREYVAEAMTYTIEAGSGSADYRVVWPDSSIHWLNCKGKAYRNETGEPIRMIGTTRDITERKLAEQKIREQAALLNIATDAILVRDFQTQILFWNKGAERLYGWEALEALGKNPAELLSEGTPPQMEEALKSIVEFDSWQGELHKVTKSGKKIIVESRWTLMRDAEGKPKSILTVDTDITEKKQLQEQFFRTQRLESLGTLAGGIAHDLNNILTPILAAAQLLQGRFAQDEERSEQLLAIVENNAKRGASLVKQVLSFARGLKGERTINQVKHLISEITQIIKQTFPKSIEFSVSIPEDLWAVSGDITQLHQVLMNLVVNARDAMPDGGQIKISAENKFIDEAYARMNLDAKVGHYVLITITDTGIGIAPEILDRIFEPFFTTKEVSKGTGLGLSTALGIIKSHGGFLKVSSQVDKGSQFELFLPAVEAAPVLTVEELETPQGEGELILVVDDEAKIREIAKIILDHHNYKTLTASNGIEAIALYAQNKNRINVVLMDMMMPEMDGITAIRTMQKMNPQVQIIACSGLNTIEVLAQAADTDVQGVLYKPYTAKDLLKSLHQILKLGAGDK